MRSWKRLCALLFVLFLLNSVRKPAQAAATSPDKTTAANAAQQALAAQALKQMATQGYPLTVNSNVADSASVEAVLLPPNIVDRIFGKETARNYLSIELIVSNHNPQASLIIESLFLDYSNWAIAPGGNDTCVNGRTATTDADGNAMTADTSAAQRLNCPEQMASAEYRLVRAEVLDHQPFTLRNLFVNGATAAGTLGTAFAFPFSRDVITGINAWNGGFIPALNTFIPDPTISQLNHISDLGFQTNKVIPKQSSDIVVAFFPIQRLFTKSIARIYRKDPAVFFVPRQMTFDPKYTSSLKKLIKANFPSYVDTPGHAYSACRSAIAKDGETLDCQVKSFFDSLAFSHIRIGIGGDMSISVQLVPPTISSIVDLPNYDAASPDNNKTFWNTLKTSLTGTVLGTYLLGGTPSIVDSSGKAIANIDIKASGSGATDSSLPIIMTINACIPATTKEMYLKVTKQTATDASVSGGGAQSSSAVSSLPFGLGTYAPTDSAGACPAPK